MKKEVLALIKKAYVKFKPISVFLYGSHATDTTNSQSDYEIGFVFKDSNYVNRCLLKDFINNKAISAFPFKHDELLTYQIDTPFEKYIYIASLISGGAKTLFGEKVIENLKSPKIEKINLVKDTCFNLGVALSAVQIFKEGNVKLANSMLYKSCFYSLRNLIIHKNKIIINGYENIYNFGKTLPLPNEYTALLDNCYRLRKEEISEIDSNFYYKNISFINRFILNELES